MPKSPTRTETPDPLKAVPDLYSAAPIGLCVLDLELRYVQVNPWLARINGLSVEQHIGRTIQEVLPHLAEIVVPQFREVIETGVPNIGGTARAETPAHPGVEHCYRHNYVAIDTDDAGIVGVSVMVEDLGPCVAKEARPTPKRALTSREVEVLRQVGLGATSREIAERMGVSTRTVDAHRRTLSLKLNIKGSARLAEFARSTGLAPAN